MNHVVLVGRLTKDPELRYIPGTGTAVATFSIAIDRDYAKKDGSRDTDFIPVEVMGKPAEFCANYISKGRLVAIQGSIRVDNYQTQSGERRTFTKVSARNIQALDSNKNRSDSPYPNQNQGAEPSFEPSFEPAGLDPQGFQAIDDDDIPF
ncbi:single-stranded DNA-binding protein [Paraclostridium ghonii]|uniref:Single-stranded DNA-binding protein n=1 Tax=Paraclostridium ghonii TaxID=29358 RepID=A0ABU0N219_9FIRM|nr:single-stranded DNA-binding protein [Paeniclostridium ghonii]MDQ0557200.1 single-strand DNA-binding protein [Paeniclostridium ghonii]